jgi:hypothetical protein
LSEDLQDDMDINGVSVLRRDGPDDRQAVTATAKLLKKLIEQDFKVPTEHVPQKVRVKSEESTKRLPNSYATGSNTMTKFVFTHYSSV